MDLNIEKMDQIEAPLVSIDVSQEFVIGAIVGAIVGLLIFT